MPQWYGLFAAWVSVALLGLWSCVGVLYRNSKKNTRQFQEMIDLLSHKNRAG